jgi:hypothetical protein
MLAMAIGAIDDAAPIGVRLLALGFGLFGVFLMFGVAVIVARTFPRSSARGVGLAMDDDGTPVLCIRQSRSRQVFGGIALLLFGAASLLVGVSLFVYSGSISVRAVLLTAAGAYLAGKVLVAAAVGAPLAELRLGPETVRLRTITTRVTATWDDIIAVEPAGAAERRRLDLAALDMQQEAGRLSWTPPWRARRKVVRIVEIQCVLFPIDPVRLYRLLDFYWADPRARAELGTEASLRRVRDGRFPRISADRPR